MRKPQGAVEGGAVGFLEYVQDRVQDGVCEVVAFEYGMESMFY